MADQTTTIPNGWKLTTLRDVAEKIAMGPFGSNIKIETFVDEGVPIISGTHLNGHKLEDKGYNFITSEHADKLKSSNVFAEDIIFTHAGNIGQVAYIPKNSKYKKYILSQRQFFLRPKKDHLQTEYLTYFFKTREGKHKLLANANQTGVPSIAQPASYLKSIEINLPPFPEQRAIVSVLSSLDDKIELLREQNKALEVTAQAIFKEWFVNFNFPGATGKMIDSELGEIPDGWRIGKLGDVVNLFDSKRIPLASDVRAKRNGQYPYYGATSIMDYIDGYLFDGTYLLLAEDGSVMDSKGHPVLQYVWGKFWVSNHAHVIQGKNGFSTEILKILLKDTNIEGIVNGAVQLKINQTNLLSFEILIPTDEVLVSFDSVLQPIFQKIQNITYQAETLSKIRDILLPKLMRGVLRVKGFEIKYEKENSK